MSTSLVHKPQHQDCALQPRAHYGRTTALGRLHSYGGPATNPLPTFKDGRLHCSFNIGSRCRHAIATVECTDCAVFDHSQGQGFYCDACFASRHPWTRAPHRFRRLNQRPVTPPPKVDPLQPAIRGVVDLLGSTRRDDAALGGSLQPRFEALERAKGAIDGVLNRLLSAMTELRDDGARKRSAAARKIQGLYRRRKARALMLTSARLLWGRVLDPITLRYYFVNRFDGRTQWEPPCVFGRVLDVGLFPKILASKLSENTAASMIQAAWRGSHARVRLAGLVRSAYRRCIDPASQREYFFCLLTGASCWSRPALLRGVDLPEYSERDAHTDVVLLARKALAVQVAWRAHAARRALAARAGARWERVWDPATRRHFFFDKQKHVSGWVKPLRMSLPSWQPPLAPREPITTEQARVVIRRFMRMCRVRWRLQPLAASLYARYFDAKYGSFFYAHRPSGRTSWKRPALLLPDTELPVEATLGATPNAMPQPLNSKGGAGGTVAGGGRGSASGHGGGSGIGGGGGRLFAGSPATATTTPMRSPAGGRTW